MNLLACPSAGDLRVEFLQTASGPGCIAGRGGLEHQFTRKSLQWKPLWQHWLNLSPQIRCGAGPPPPKYITELSHANCWLPLRLRGAHAEACRRNLLPLAWSENSWEWSVPHITVPALSYKVLGWTHHNTVCYAVTNSVSGLPQKQLLSSQCGLVGNVAAKCILVRCCLSRMNEIPFGWTIMRVCVRTVSRLTELLVPVNKKNWTVL